MTEIDTMSLGRVAVLGGTGLIGRHVVEALSQAGASDIVATRHVREAPQIDGVNWHSGDLTDLAQMQRALAGAQAVVLCAGRVSTTAELRRDPISSVLETQRIGINALEVAARVGLPRLVMVGSCTGYPAGLGLKSEQDMFHGDPPPGWFGVGWMHRFLEKHLEWSSGHLGRIASGTTLRLTMVYGPHDDFSRASGHFIPSMISQIVARDKPIEVWGDGSQTRNILHAADVAQAVIAVLAAPQPGYAVYNVAAPNSFSVNQVLQNLIEVDGFNDAEIVHRLDKAGGVSAMQISAEPFRARFGWQPRLSLRDGLAQTVQWYRSTLKSHA